MRRLTLFVVLFAFVFSCGGQWYVLQGIAWANMIREYAQMVPLTQAVQMTFSGKYPCALCKAIAEKKQSENLKIAALEKETKKRVSPGLGWVPPAADVSPQDFVVRDRHFQTRSEVPPTPPPRFA
jgi:hypothetical protein